MIKKLFAALTTLRTNDLEIRGSDWIVMSLLVIAAISVVAESGILSPTGIFLFGLVIIIAGILLGTRYAFYSSFATIVILAVFKFLSTHDVMTPSLSWAQHPAQLSDILGFAIIYIIIALLSWLYNLQRERSLRRAWQSQAALRRQKKLLEEAVQERTRQLEAAQLEKFQQVYRFAELGRISSALFHELANHLSNVFLDIEGLALSDKSSLIKQIQDDIGYIDNIVQRVRLQLRGQGSVERFEVAKQIKTVTKVLNYKLVQSGIKLELELPAEPLYYKGDTIPFRQVISNLLVNAIEACAATPAIVKPDIIIKVAAGNKTIIIVVQDWATTITPTQRKKIFEAFYSSKVDGTGIGLFIVQHIVENDLHGSISLTSDRKNGTAFTVTIPQNN